MNDPICFTCPSCHARFKDPHAASWIGRKIRCTKCQTVFVLERVEGPADSASRINLTPVVSPPDLSKLEPATNNPSAQAPHVQSGVTQNTATSTTPGIHPDFKAVQPASSSTHVCPFCSTRINDSGTPAASSRKIRCSRCGQAFVVDEAMHRSHQAQPVGVGPATGDPLQPVPEATPNPTNANPSVQTVLNAIYRVAAIAKTRASTMSRRQKYGVAIAGMLVAAGAICLHQYHASQEAALEKQLGEQKALNQMMLRETADTAALIQQIGAAAQWSQLVQSQSQQRQTTVTARCPYCKEPIQGGARKCPHCGTAFSMRDIPYMFSQ